MPADGFLIHGLDDMVAADTPPGQFLFLGLFLADRCNLRCRYCYNYEQDYRQTGLVELTLQQKLAAVRAAATLGAKVLFLVGFGEPLLDPDFRQITSEAHQSGLITLLYTNGTIMDPALAGYLCSHNATVMVKLEAMSPEIHDRLTQVADSHRKAMEAIDLLLKAGYKSAGRTKRLGVAALYTKPNAAEVVKVYEWSRKMGIGFNCDIVGYYGRALRHREELWLSHEEIQAIMRQIPGESSYKGTHGCLFWSHGITIDHYGLARFCSEKICSDIGSLQEQSLQELLARKAAQYPAQTGRFTCPMKEISPDARQA